MRVDKFEALELLRADIKKANEEEKRVCRDFGSGNQDLFKTAAKLDHLTTSH